MKAVQHNDYLNATQLFAETALCIAEGISGAENCENELARRMSVVSIQDSRLAEHEKGFTQWLPVTLLQGFPNVEHSGALWGPFWLLCHMLYLGPEHCDFQRFKYVFLM